MVATSVTRRGGSSLTNNISRPTLSHIYPGHGRFLLIVRIYGIILRKIVNLKPAHARDHWDVKLSLGTRIRERQQVVWERDDRIMSEIEKRRKSHEPELSSRLTSGGMWKGEIDGSNLQYLVQVP